MNSCEKYQELISLMLDGELSTEKTIELNVHMARCPECRAMYEAFAELGDTLKSDVCEMPAGLHDRIMTGVKAASGKKRGAVIQLKHYISAAACVVLIVAAVLAVKGTGVMSGSSADMAMNMSAAVSEAAMDTAAAEAAPAEAERQSAENGTAYAAGAAADGESVKSAETASAPEAETMLNSGQVELDIVSSQVTVKTEKGTDSESLEATDSRIWLETLIEGSSKFADGEDLSLISYEFTAVKSDGGEYTVYMFYSDDRLHASLSEDKSEGVPINNIAQFAALVGEE